MNIWISLYSCSLTAIRAAAPMGADKPGRVLFDCRLLMNQIHRTRHVSPLIVSSQRKRLGLHFSLHCLQGLMMAGLFGLAIKASPLLQTSSQTCSLVAARLLISWYPGDFLELIGLLKGGVFLLFCCWGGREEELSSDLYLDSADIAAHAEKRRKAHGNLITSSPR